MEKSVFATGRIKAKKAGIFNGMPNGGFNIDGLWYNYRDKDSDMKAVQDYMACWPEGSKVAVTYTMEGNARIIKTLSLVETEEESKQEGFKTLKDILKRARKDKLVWSSRIIRESPEGAVVECILMKEGSFANFTAFGEASKITVKGPSVNYLALAETRAVKRALRWYYGATEEGEDETHEQRD